MQKLMARVAACAIGAALSCFGDVIYLGPQPGVAVSAASAQS